MSVVIYGLGIAGARTCCGSESIWITITTCWEQTTQPSTTSDDATRRETSLVIARKVGFFDALRRRDRDVLQLTLTFQLHLNALISPGVEHLDSIGCEGYEIGAEIGAARGVGLPLEMLALLRLNWELRHYASRRGTNEIVKQSLFVVRQKHFALLLALVVIIVARKTLALLNTNTKRLCGVLADLTDILARTTLIQIHKTILALVSDEEERVEELHAQNRVYSSASPIEQTRKNDLLHKGLIDWDAVAELEHIDLAFPRSNDNVATLIKCHQGAATRIRQICKFLKMVQFVYLL